MRSHIHCGEPPKITGIKPVLNTGDLDAEGGWHGPDRWEPTRAGAGFGPGTMIMTQDGEVPVEWLATGDRVLTLDHGFQPILWIGRTVLDADHAERNPGQRPVRIAAQTLSDVSPTHDLIVTADHRLLLASPWAELYHLSSEVLVPAAAWARGTRPVEQQARVTVTQLLFAGHEIILAQGAWVESMCVTPEMATSLSPAMQERLSAVLGSDAPFQKAARPCVSLREAGLLIRTVDQSAPMPDRQPRRYRA